ncbi:MAG: 1-deoxy-D-xylulose-5-phosphate reductoisomerase [Bdellovibrionales bacterium]|nr:1-deoxy-D-xylulose-5-phosphate reductoisomerase [Bdellovibrionales bacterium]
MKNVAILGSTGSIGKTALAFIEKHPNDFKVVAMTAGDNIELLEAQIQQFNPEFVSTRSENALSQLRQNLAHQMSRKIDFDFGTRGAETVGAFPKADIVLSAIVGAAGLRPTIAAAKAGKTIALANKESLVVAGAFVTQTAKENGATILPVDSEHSAIFQCMLNSQPDDIERLILTASGGPFFLQPELDLSSITKEQALKHPNWSMGEKITIDSATMMNKGLEAIEACWLFDMPSKKVGVVVHPQSIIHSMVEYIDGSVIAQLGVPDMTGPIAYALAYPKRLPKAIERLNFSKLKTLTFFEADHHRFPSVNLALHAFNHGPTFPAVLNGSNEVTVRAFLDGKIQFTDIAAINEAVLFKYSSQSASCLEDFIEADQWGRHQAEHSVRHKEK